MAEVRANLFYEREEWKTPLLVSVAFHGMLVLAMAGLGYVMAPRGSTNWGSSQSNVPVVEAQIVSSSIPIPQPPAPTDNIVANESKAVTHSVPQPKDVETDDGISIKGKPPKKTIDRPVTPTHTPARPVPTPLDTAVPAGEGGPVSGPYGAITAPNMKGGVSVQEASFGDKYPYYIKMIRDTVVSNWRQWEIDPSIKAPHRAFVEFEIRRDGAIESIQVAQSSGVPRLDQSATRALQRIEKFAALPEGSVLHVQIWFDYPPK